MTKTKWQSRRWLICVWAIIMVTWLVVTQSDISWAGTAISLLLAIIGGYIAADSLTKPKGL
jgi:multisubunit Na+/H+ antiporter MnhE subunit